jgi:hypothetical protein
LSEGAKVGSLSAFKKTLFVSLLLVQQHVLLLIL